MNYKIEAIVLDAKECREYDRIYTILSHGKGKMSLIGVGTRKPKAKLASGMEPLTKNEIFLIKCRGLDRLKGVLIDNQYPNIKGDYEKVIMVRRSFRILNMLLPEGEECDDVFDALSDFLDIAENGTQNKCRIEQEVLFAQLVLLWRAIAWSGITPSLYCCIACRKKIQSSEKFIFSVPNGLKCPKCFGQREANSFYVSPDAVKLLRIFLSEEKSILRKIKVPQKVIAELHNVTRHVLIHITERKIIL